jgi:hypothetical protein
MQIRLNENGNTVQIVYGNVVGPATAGTVQVGIKGQNNTDFRARTSTTSWAATTNAATASETIAFSTTIVPASGLTFTFTPPPNCAGTPPVATILTTPNSPSFCFGSQISFTASGFVPALGHNYQWQQSANGTDWINVTGATNLNYVGSFITPSSVRLSITCTNSNETTFSTPFSVSLNQPLPATLPYTESFEATWTSCSGDTLRAVPNASWATNISTGSNSWRRSDDRINGGWPNNLGAYTPLASQGLHSARFNSYNTITGSTGDLYLFFNANTASASKRLTFMYFNTSGNDSLSVGISTDGGLTFRRLDSVRSGTSAWRRKGIDFSATGASVILRFRQFGVNTSGDAGIDDLRLENLDVCNGVPAVPTITAQSTNLCVGTSTRLRLSNTNNFLQGGNTFQWQISNDGTTWRNVTSGGNDTIFNYTLTANPIQLARLRVLCSNTNDSSFSSPINFTLVQPTYATIPFNEGFENTWVYSGCDTMVRRDVPSTSFRNSPMMGNNSWRRDDDGLDANWGSATFGVYTPTGSNNSNRSARFHSYLASSGTRGSLDLYLNCNTSSPFKQLAFDYINTSGADSLEVFVSNDNGLTFTKLRAYRNATSWSTNTLEFSSNSERTVVRFLATSDFGATDIGIDSIRVTELSVCSGTPVTGTAASSASSYCFNSQIALTASGFSQTVGGLNYQWQKSTNNISWTNIAGANNPGSFNDVTGNATTTLYYRLFVRCSVTNDSAVSNVVTIAYSAPSYATLPIIEGFENTWVELCDTTRNVPNNSWRANPTIGNNSWRRNDDGADANWTSPTLGVYTPSGSNTSTYSARFHTYDASTGSRGTLDVYFNANTATARKRLNFDYINTSGSDSLEIFLSVDDGQNFVKLGNGLRTATSWTNNAYLFSTSSANCVIRFRATSDFGTTDIGIDNVVISEFPDCSTLTAGGSAASNLSTICTGSIVTLSASGMPANQAGLSYQWERSADGNTGWTPIANATNPNVFTFTTGANLNDSSYRLVTTCSTNLSTITSSVVRIQRLALPTYATVPYVQSFENAWANACSVRDIPETGFWRNTPFNGNTSWRRDNDTTGAGWTNMNNPAAPTGASASSRYARFHSSILTTGTGTLDLFVNCASGNASKEVKFFYANTNGTDSLRVFVSTDGGTNFTRVGSVLTTSNATNFWDEVSIPFTSTSATTIIRFVAYATGTNASDIGIDEVSVSAVDCAQPQNVQVTAFTPAGASTTRATVTWNNVAGNLGYEIAFAATNTPPSFGDVVLPNIVTYLDTTTVNANSNAFAFVRTFCAGGATSSWAVVPFVAPCAVGEIPYNEGFESITTANTLPECMSATQLGTLTQTYLGRESNYYRKPRTGSKFAAFRYSATNRHLFSRPLLLQAGVQYGAEVWYVSDGTGFAGWDSLKLQIATNQTQAGIIHSMARVAPVPNSSIDTNYVRVAGNFTPTTTGIYYLTVSAYGTSAPWYLSFDDLQLAPGNALPVTISSFTAERKGSTNLLQWITSTEANNLGFEIERSADGRNFTKVGYVASSATNGNSTQPISYNFTDALPLTGNNYYRLKQIDKDGKTSYSNIALVKGNFGKELTLTAVYPNPATTTLNVLMNAPAFSKTQIVVTDLAGKVLNTYNYQLNAGDNTLSVNVAALPSGTYLIKAICDNGCESAVKKFFKQ